MPEPLRVLYVNPMSQIGGGEVSLLLLLRGLNRERFHPTMICPEEGPFAERVRAEGVECQIHPFCFEPRPRTRAQVWTSDIVQLGRIIYQGRYGLVHSNTFYHDKLTPFAGKMAGVPVLIHLRDILYRGGPILRASGWACSGIVSISRTVSQSLLDVRIPKRKIHLVHNGVDTQEFRPGIDAEPLRRRWDIENSIVVGIASRLAPDKGHLDFLRAARIVAEKHPNARFLVLGDAVYADSKYGESVRKLASELGIEDKCRFVGFQSEMARAISTMDVMVIASHAEPFGRTVIEAMACGKPVIGTNVAGPAETIEDGRTGLLVPIKSPDRMAEAICAMVRDRSLRERMGSAARQVAEEHYSLEAHARNMMALYEKTLEDELGRARSRELVGGRGR